MRERSMFGFPWPPAHKKAFQLVAERIQTGKTKGNASELARTVLEQFMFGILGTKEARNLGIMSPWEREIPPPAILEYAVEKYKQHRGRLVDVPVSDTAVDSEIQSEKEIVKSLKNSKRHLTKAS